MAPVTRRAAKAQEILKSNSNSPAATRESSAITSPTRKETLFEEPIVLRSKRKSLGDASEEGQEQGAEDANTKAATPTRNKLEVRVKDDVVGAKSPIEVHIPSSTIKTPRARSSPVPDSQASDAGDEANQTIEPFSASKQLEEEATQTLASQSRSRSLESGQESTPLSKVARAPRSGSKRKSLGKSTPRQTKPEEEPEKEPEKEATPQPEATTKSTHVVFGDDDDVDKFVAAAADKNREEIAKESEDGDGDEGENAESDDEAPEAVSTAAAAKETLKSARAAIEAAEQYAASTKRKRQARDNLLKQQAEKRRRTRPSTTAEKEGSPEGDDDDDVDDDDVDVEDERRNATSSKRQRRTHKLPDVLPAEFLTDSSEDEGEGEGGTVLKKMVRRPQKITFETAVQFLGAEGKGPRDEIVGSTRYRVLAGQSDQRLAPRADKNSLRAKEALLRRGRERVTPNKKRGFFVKR